MKSLCRVQLLGRLGRDAETKHTPNGTSVTSFSIATDRRVKINGEWKSETDWHNIVVWQAENISNYLLKGRQIYLEGRLQTRAWGDKEGRKQYRTEVVCNSGDVILLGGDSKSKSDDWENSPPVQTPSQAYAPQSITDDEVPF